jgi:hypothetical protein
VRSQIASPNSAFDLQHFGAMQQVAFVIPPAFPLRADEVIE